MTAAGRRFGAAATLAVLVALVFPRAPAPGQDAGASVGDVGWWTRQLGAMPMGPGAFRVARQPDGDTSVAAIEVTVAGGVVSAATLTLAESGGVAADQAAMRVCTTSAPWEPADPGALAAAPIPDCARAVPLARDPATSLWRAPVAALLGPSGSTSLMVVPDPATGLALFQVDVASATIYAEIAPSLDGDAIAVTPPEPDPGPPFPTGGITFDVAPLPAPMTPFALPVPVAEPAVTPSTPDAVETGPVPFVAAAQRSGGGDPKPWSRLLWMVPVAAVAGIAIARRPSQPGAESLRRPLA